MPQLTAKKTGIWLKEIILENFMSYEYARIPLKPGLNLISGPNGAGKSSILLAISVALGQIYTERSKRLRDLIRRGEEIGRVTLVFDNKEKNGERLLPIVIGLSEASAIKMKIGGFTPPRPLTHDLLYSTIESLEANLEKIVIDRLEENTFYAKLVVKDNSGQTKMIDARPSDSIALAVRAGVSIFVDESVVKQSEVFNK